jgi:hypothetical protein
VSLLYCVSSVFCFCICFILLLHGPVFLTVYVYLMHDWYIFGAWLIHSLMVQVEVQVGAWLMHLFMIQVDYKLFGHVIVTGYLYRFGGWLMHLFMV